MNRRHRLLAFVAVLLGFAALLPTASTASAAPPGNDDIAGATVLGPVPFHLEQSTTEATTSADEAAFNDFCGAPVLEHGVWFTATAVADANVVADVTGSDFSAGILVLGGEPGNLSPLLCAPGLVSGPVVAGQTIYLLVFGDGLTEATSGQLVLDTYLAPSPPAVAVTIDPRGTVDKAGVVRVSGTVSCTSDDPEGILFDVSGTLRQRVGRGFVNGFFYSEQLTPCDGVTRRWRAEAFGDGTFAGGKSAAATLAFGCDTFSCGEGYVEATIQLSRNG
jgi:hypothetical protein